MTKPPGLNPEQHANITAALFRREETSAIAREHSISERQVRRIAQNLRTYGTVSAPRTKKMGRPNVLTREIEDDLRAYVEGNPLALLSDMQKWINDEHDVKVSRASLSRRMKELGFTRGVVRRGAGLSTDETLPSLSQVDYARLLNEEGVDESGMGTNAAPARTKYAWLLDGEPVVRRPEPGGEAREKKRRGMVGSGKGHRHKKDGANNPAGEDTNIEDTSIQPDLETAVNPVPEGQMELDILGNVASHSEYAMPLQQQSGATEQDAIDNDLRQQSHFRPEQPEQFQQLRQHLPPYLPPLERQPQVTSTFPHVPVNLGITYSNDERYTTG